MFFCQICKKGHLKPKPNSHHQFVSIDEGLKVKDGGTFASSSSSSTSSSSSSTTTSSITSSSRITRCHKHPHLEVNSYCERCKEACCAECVVDYHSEHKIVRLATVSEQLKGDIATFINKVKKYDSELSQAIKETAETLAALKKQAKVTEEQVHQIFENLRHLLDDREAELIGDIEKEKHQKEKDLLIQKEDLEFLLKGIRDSVNFSERLVNEGNGVEIAASHKPVFGRFETLETEMKKTSLSPVTDEVIEFFGGSNGVEESKKMMKTIGAIVVKEIIFAEKSSVLRNGQDAVVSLNQKYSLEVSLVDQKGSKVTRVPNLASTGGGIQVKIEGPSKDVKVDIIERPAEQGKQSLSFTLNEVGEHEISVLFKEKHFQGSPFQLKVINSPIYRRDFGLVGDEPLARFGSKGEGDGQFTSPYAVASNLKGDIIVAEYSGHRIQVLDQNGKFLFKFGSEGNGKGQFNYPNGVTVDYGKNNQIVVVDYGNNRIQVFDDKGGFIRSFGTRGNNDGQLSNPRGVVVDQTNGNYFVTDGYNHRVQAFNSNGVFIRKFGFQGTGNGKFTGPYGIGLLSNGNLVVGENGGNRIQIVDQMGTFVRMIASNKELGGPWHLFVDSGDNILVADRNKSLIQIFDSSGKHCKTIGQGWLSQAGGICMDLQGRIIVCEDTQHRISIF